MGENLPKLKILVTMCNAVPVRAVDAESGS